MNVPVDAGKLNHIFMNRYPVKRGFLKYFPRELNFNHTEMKQQIKSSLFLLLTSSPVGGF